MKVILASFDTDLHTYFIPIESTAGTIDLPTGTVVLQLNEIPLLEGGQSGTVVQQLNESPLLEEGQKILVFYHISL